MANYSINRFVFGVLCYKQESLVAETLESIRYQVLNYGNGVEVSIVITDDNSPDSTQAVIRNWLAKRDSCFSSVTVQFNEENRGVVFNYRFLMSQIGNRPFKIIAGDDLISSRNIFQAAARVEPHSIDAYVPMLLKDGRVFVSTPYLRERFYNIGKQRTRKYDLTMFRRGGYLSTPTVLYSMQSYIDSDADLLNSRFTLFEDDPTFYSILRNLDDSKVRFLKGSIVLYRIHEESISNASRPNPGFEKEMAKLRDVYISDSGWLERRYLRSKNYPHKLKILKLDRYLDKAHELKVLLYCALHAAAYRSFARQAQSQAAEEQEFYHQIKCDSVTFLRSRRCEEH